MKKPLLTLVSVLLSLTTFSQFEWMTDFNPGYTAFEITTSTAPTFNSSNNSNHDYFNTPNYGSKTGNMNQNGNGHIRIAYNDGNGGVRWKREYYYIYFYQYVYIYNGQLKNENHNMNFNGFLSKGSKPHKVGLTYDEKFVLYENEHYYLKVPYESHRAIWFKQKFSNPAYNVDCVGPSWQRLTRN
jgi:hypothetical protein